MRYVLWSGAATGIGLPRTHLQARRMIDASAGWRAAVAELGARRLIYDPRIGISCIEVQSHGQPAGLQLPDESPRGLIDHTTVSEFGMLLKPHLATGALIELMACQVAAVGTEVDFKPRVVTANSQSDFWPVAPTDLPQHAYSASINSQYWDVLAGDAERMFQERQGRALKPGEAERNRVHYDIRRSYKWPAASDGLSFCLALAAASGVTVRASNVSQAELPSSNPAFAVDTFGNWEGHTWDFLPSGEVRYLGLNLKRTQPVVAWRSHDTAHNPRPMTGLTADVGLRAGRPNRNPLPV